MSSMYVNFAELSNEYDGQEIHYPSLDEIEKIIKTLDGVKFTAMSLERVSYKGKDVMFKENSNSLQVRGGLNNQYEVVFHPVKEWYYAVGLGSSNEWINCYEVHEDGSSGLIRADLVIDLSATLRVATYFAQYGEQHLEYEFKKVDHDEIYEGRRAYLKRNHR